MDRYRLIAKGEADNSVIEFDEYGRASSVPECLQQLKFKTKDEIERRLKRWGWDWEPLVEIIICDPLGVGNWPY